MTQSPVVLVRFREPARARENLERVRPRIGPPAARSLSTLLAQLPDPDGSLNLLERFTGSAPPAVLDYVGAHAEALHYLLAVFSYSAFLSETLLREPELIVHLHSSGTLFRLKSREEMREEFRGSAAGSPPNAPTLARFKRREYLRITLRDVLKLATLAEVTLELSALADALLEAALEGAQAELAARLGRPACAFTILSLGKLGGNELNYSSDIDLLFLYREPGETTAGVTHKEYFVRLAGRITHRITAMTPEGQVFRVDLRLRPQGREGELAISLPAALDYYRKRARDWELQALVKGRHSAGDATLAREFLESVQPLVYRGEPNFAALDSVLFAREHMSEELRRAHPAKNTLLLRRRARSPAVDVKLGRGGIRDIEFLGQCLQRLYGGQEPWLRSGATLFALQKLADKGLLSSRDHGRLSRAYHFLRIVEHRLQLERGQQTHRVPEDPEALDLLARRTGVEKKDGPAGPALLQHLERHMGEVREIYDRLILKHGAALGRQEEVRAHFALEGQAAAIPSELSFPELLRLMEVSQPELYAAVRRLWSVRNAEFGMQNQEIFGIPHSAFRIPHSLQRFLLSAYSRPAGLAALAAAPALLERAAVLFEESAYLSELLIRNPEDIEVLGEIGSGASAESQLPMAVETPYVVPEDPLLEHIVCSQGPLTEKMALLRRHYRRRLLRIQAHSILEAAPVFQTLEATTCLAEQMIRAALHVALGNAECGMRNAELKDTPHSAFRIPHSFTVVALGRLGVREFDVASDADLAFVFSSDGSTEQEGKLFWVRAAQRFIEVLSSHTGEGTIFAVDSRLRPRGREGELVESARYVEEYFRSQAEPWEAITYMKSRAVAGDLGNGTALLARVQSTVGARFGSGPQAGTELVEMRRRLEATANPHNYWKTAAGGYYDIDFLLTFLRLRAAGVFFPSLNTLERLSVVERMGQLSAAQAAVLGQGAVFLRAFEHALRLASGRSDTELPISGPAAAAFARLAERWFPEPLRGRPIAEILQQVMAGVRQIFNEVFGS